jgi:hypothetical protein
LTSTVRKHKKLYWSVAPLTVMEPPAH